jgi:hypothetical protein
MSNPAWEDLTNLKCKIKNEEKKEAIKNAKRRIKN